MEELEKMNDVEISTEKPNEPLDPEKDKNEKENDSEIKEKKGRCECEFPSAFTILLIIQLIVFLLIYIIPKGKYDKLEYSDSEEKFIITKTNGTEERVAPTQEWLDNHNIKVPLNNFKKGLIKNPMSIPNTYERIKGETVNFLNVVYFPILGLVQSANLSFFLMLLGGCLNIINELNALSAGVKSLMKLTRGKEFLLLCIIYVLCSIATSTYGMAEETFAFYPILIPICLKSGIDPILVIGTLYLSILVGNMFSTFNAFSVVVASYSSGIRIIDGIVFRVICLVIVDILTILYFYHYYRKIKIDEKNSLCYDIKEELTEKFLKDKIEDVKNVEINFEKTSNKEKFTLKQKIVLILFFISIIALVLGVILLNWSFEHMGSISLVLALILMIFLGKKENEAVKVFMKGVSDFSGIAIILGISYGINITLVKGQISDTILYGLTYVTSELPKVIFAILIFIIFNFLGFLFAGWTALAIISMPVFAPLADEVGVPRTLIVNAYLFGQSFIQIISPSAYTLIVVELAGIQYYHWLKFIYPYMIILFFILLGLIMLNSLF